MPSFHQARPILAMCVLLGAVACSSAPPASPTPAAKSEAFAVVRATAEAAYQQGKQQLARGQLEEALVNLDRAKVNDPDNRADIQSALDETLAQIRALPPAPTATAGPVIALPTIPAFTLPPPGAPVNPSNPIQPGLPAPPFLIPSAVPSPAVASAQPQAMRTWEDPAGKFNLLAPVGWQTQSTPSTTFGRGIIQFRDPAGLASVDVAEDAAEGVSPELYAARMELQMQKLPGYASESALPAVNGGSPTLRRSFVLTARDANGKNQELRGFQLVLVHLNIAYVLSALAPSARYGEFAPTFEQMASSFTVH